VFAGKFGAAKYMYGYEAACCAVLTAAGRDAELTAFGIEEWVQLNDLALKWLRTEFDYRIAQAKDPGNWAEVRGELLRWKQEPELRRVRERAWLAAMRREVRKEWERFWDDVDVGLAWVSRRTPPK